MNVLTITGDPSFKPGNPRFDIQAQAVDMLSVVYWGPNAQSPKIPKRSFDVVTVQDPFWRGFFAWRVARKLNARFNVQLHADFEAQSWTKKLIGKFVLTKADSVRVVSEKLKKQVQALGATTPITVLPIFVNLEKFENIVRRPAPEPTILWIGRFEDEKDPLRAIEVFRKVQETLPDAKLIILGTGSLEKKLRHAARGMAVESPGWRDTVPYLSYTTVVLSTSKAESYGASIVEALAAGVPVIAPDVGVAREAGAIVVSKHELARSVLKALHTKPKGKLAFETLSESEWIEKWIQSLV